MQSSSYRCFDRQLPVLIESSSIENVEQMTLDVATLMLKDNLSAIAVPFKHHGQRMGVLNLDINDSRRRRFSPHDLKLLTRVAELLPPILHNSLTVETITKITDVILNKKRADEDQIVLATVCKAICDYLAVPWSAIFLRHEALDHRLVLCGYNGRLIPQEILNQLQMIDLDALGPTARDVLVKKQRNAAGTFTDCFPVCIHPTATITCRVFNLRDKSGLVDGFLMLAGGTPSTSDSFLRLCTFIADFTSLTLGALKQFDFRARDAYETAAHELTRNLNQLRNTQKRLERVQSTIDSHYRLERIPEERILHELRTVKNANSGHLLTAEQTLRNLIDTPRQDTKSPGTSQDAYSSPILMEARRRQQKFNSAEKKTTIDLRNEINDICNSFNRVMTAKNVTWDWSKFGILPKLIELDRQNFHTIFENLIDNAVKYSKPNTKIRLISDVEELCISLTVINTGPPIDFHGPESSDIFIARYRGLAASKMAKGLGLGLWQASLVAKLWGGDPLRLSFSEPLPSSPGDVQTWASIAFALEIPILNPDHIISS
jgi:signal transduction histidine kinase